MFLSRSTAFPDRFSVFGPFGSPSLPLGSRHVPKSQPCFPVFLRESVNLLLRFESRENAGPFRGNLAIFRAFCTTFLPRLTLICFFLAPETHTASGEVSSSHTHSTAPPRRARPPQKPTTTCSTAVDDLTWLTLDLENPLDGLEQRAFSAVQEKTTKTTKTNQGTAG